MLQCLVYLHYVWGIYMGLLDGFEKLINEHGSSTILRERIALANDKYAALESEMKKQKSEKLDLEKENERLRHDLRKAQVQIRKLEGQQIPIAESHVKVLPVEQQSILLLLMKEGLIEGDVIKVLDRGAEAIRFDLVDLANTGLIDCQNLCGAGTFCSLTQDGRRYLKTNGLLT